MSLDGDDIAKAPIASVRRFAAWLGAVGHHRFPDDEIRFWVRAKLNDLGGS